jgi:HSP20 family molecular chaperone IbpA
MNTPFDRLNEIVPAEFRDSIMRILTNDDTKSKSNSKNIVTSLARSNDNIIIYAEMPGFTKNTIDIGFYNNNIQISGNKPAPEHSDEYKYSKSDIKYGLCSQSINLPISVTNKENVIVKYTDGILKIDIDLTKERQNQFKINLGDNTVDKLD